MSRLVKIVPNSNEMDSFQTPQKTAGSPTCYTTAQKPPKRFIPKNSGIAY